MGLKEWRALASTLPHSSTCGLAIAYWPWEHAEGHLHPALTPRLHLQLMAAHGGSPWHPPFCRSPLCLLTMWAQQGGTPKGHRCAGVVCHQAQCVRAPMHTPSTWTLLHTCHAPTHPHVPARAAHPPTHPCTGTHMHNAHAHTYTHARTSTPRSLRWSCCASGAARADGMTRPRLSSRPWWICRSWGARPQTPSKNRECRAPNAPDCGAGCLRSSCAFTSGAVWGMLLGPASIVSAGLYAAAGPWRSFRPDPPHMWAPPPQNQSIPIPIAAPGVSCLCTCHPMHTSHHSLHIPLRPRAASRTACCSTCRWSACLPSAMQASRSSSRWC